MSIKITLSKSRVEYERHIISITVEGPTSQYTPVYGAFFFILNTEHILNILYIFIKFVYYIKYKCFYINKECDETKPETVVVIVVLQIGGALAQVAQSKHSLWNTTNNNEHCSRIPRKTKRKGPF